MTTQGTLFQQIKHSKVTSATNSRNEVNDPNKVKAWIDEQYRGQLLRDGRVKAGGVVTKRRKVRDDETGEVSIVSVKEVITEVSLCDRTVRDIKSIASITDRKGQPLDMARLIALWDIRVVHKASQPAPSLISYYF